MQADSNSSLYYRRRADRQSQLADAADAAGVRAIHRELADRYRALADGIDAAPGQPKLRLA